MSGKLQLCPFCGSAVEPGSEFCSNCGAALADVEVSSSSVKIISETPTYSQQPSQPYYQPQQTQPYTQRPVYATPTHTIYTPQKQDDSAGVVSLIFGILACVGILPCIGSIVAIASGNSAKGSSTASVGVTLGWIALCLQIIGAIVFFSTFAFWW